MLQRQGEHDYWCFVAHIRHCTEGVEVNPFYSVLFCPVWVFLDGGGNHLVVVVHESVVVCEAYDCGEEGWVDEERCIGGVSLLEILFKVV